MWERSWPRGGTCPWKLSWKKRSPNKRLAPKAVGVAWVGKAEQRNNRAEVVAAWSEAGLEPARGLREFADEVGCFVAAPAPTWMFEHTKRHLLLCTG